MPTPETLTCPVHGDAYATFVCGHLFDNPRQVWISDFPDESNAWPDAWCSACHIEFLKAGEWNDDNSDCLALKILCHQCYEVRIAESVDSLAGATLATWEELLERGQTELAHSAEALTAEYGLSRHQRWDYDQATGLLEFSNDGIPAVVCEIEFIGSFSKQSGTWLWSWANFHNLANVRTRIKAVRDYGEARGLPPLTVPKFPAVEDDGWALAGVAAHVLKARGVYRVPSAYGFLFIALLDVRHAEPG